jgi:hypothetical protein
MMFVAEFSDACENPFTVETYSVCSECECFGNPGHCQVTGTFFSDSSCTQSPVSFDATECSNMQVTAASAIVSVATVAVPGDCSPYSPPHWMCRLPEGQSCVTSDSKCALKEKLADPCVVVAGTECPSGYMPHTAGLRLYPDECGCSCSKDFETSDCYGHVFLWPYQSCKGFEGLGSILSVDPNCQPFEAMDIASLETPETEVTCGVGQAAPTGIERTICCLE